MESERQLLRQWQIVAQLEAGGHNTDEEPRLLARFEQLLAMHRADRDRILSELSE